MSLDIKICGLKTDAALAAALAGGATHVGFIFFPKSPRNVEPAEAGRLREAAVGRAKAVAVTVDADDAFLDAIVAAWRPTCCSCTAARAPERVAEVKARYGLPVMKALSIARAGRSRRRSQPYRGVADRLLFDAKPPPAPNLPGGNGVAFDWRLLAGLDAGARLHAFGWPQRRPISARRWRWPTRPASTFPRASRARRASRTRR